VTGRFEGTTLAKVVAFSLIAVVMTIGLGMKIANVGFFRDTYTLNAVFEDATGVFEGDAVKLAGVDVGRVTGTEIEDGRAVVSFDVDRSVRLTTDSVVGIRWRNVIGLRFLYVYPGAGGGRVLEDGDRIPLSHTDSAGDIGEFLNRLGPILKAIDPEKANAFLDAVNTALSGQEAVVRTLFSEGATLAGELGDLDTEIQSLIRHSDRIMAAYASQDDEIGAIIEDLDTLGGDLAGMTEEINSLVVNFAAVQQEMDRLLEENRGNIDASISNLNSVARTLAQRRGALERTLCSLPAGVHPYDQTSSWGEWFNVRIVRFVVKDDQGNIIASQGEGPDARDNQAPPVVECPRGRPRAHHVSGPPPETGPVTEPAGGGDLGPWLDRVTGAADG
jgi:phospholipid/cholesterol/gamma-HCH transport system substrate-binding protein